MTNNDNTPKSLNPNAVDSLDAMKDGKAGEPEKVEPLIDAIDAAIDAMKKGDVARLDRDETVRWESPKM